jgi:lysosomal acid lipase/cholesteryl ester hydrolase
MFDSMLEQTNSSRAFYVGHSQAAACLMVLLSMRPKYNEKIIQAHLLAPAVFMNNLPHPLIRFFASEFNAFIDKYQYYDFLSNTQIMNFIEPVNSFICQKNSPVINMCANFVSMICGRNENGTETDMKILPELIKHLAHAVSTKQFHHFIQLYQSGKFQHYNYQSRNKFIYNQSSPPDYELSNVKTTIYLYSGKNDMLVAESVRYLRKYLHCKQSILFCFDLISGCGAFKKCSAKCVFIQEHKKLQPL